MRPIVIPNDEDSSEEDIKIPFPKLLGYLF